MWARQLNGLFRLSQVPVIVRYVVQMAIRKVLVLFGGVSTEHVISLRSAFNIIGGLRRAGYTVQCTGIAQNGDWLAYTGSDEAILDGFLGKAGPGAGCRPIASPCAFAP